jgi:hypothetical protein
VNIIRVLNEAERKALLKKFGSLKAVRGAPIDEIAGMIGAEKTGRILTAADNPPALPLVITRINELGGGANDLRPIKARIDD